LVAESSPEGKLGGSFGLHKMFDMAGSSIGAFLAFLFIATSLSYHAVFLLAIIPTVIGVMLIPLIREKRNALPCGEKLSFRGLHLTGKTKMYFIVIFLFCLGNSSNVFLLLKAKTFGFSTAQVMLLYLIFNISTSILAIPSGKLSDRFGRKAILVPGYLIYGLVYLGFAWLTAKYSIVFLFIAYGAYTACISGAERAFISEASPAGYKGTVLGIYGMLQGIGLLFASIIAGALWDNINSDAPFVFGGILGLTSAVAIAIILGSSKFRKPAGPPADPVCAIVD
jgi:MFS family permease